ncbi:MAG: hypothetical protein QXY39_07250, partial [Thermofilaceae archaeon]
MECGLVSCVPWEGCGRCAVWQWVRRDSFLREVFPAGLASAGLEMAGGEVRYLGEPILREGPFLRVSTALPVR